MIFRWGEDFVLSQISEEGVLFPEGRHLGEGVESEVSPVELAFPEVGPFAERDRGPGGGLHGEGITVNDVDRKDGRGGVNTFLAGVTADEPDEYLKEVLPAFVNVVFQEFDAVDGHEGEEGVMELLEVAAAVSGVDGCEFSAEDWDEEVPGPACRLQESGVNTFGFVGHEVDHCFDNLWRGEHFPVVDHPLFGLHQAHALILPDPSAMQRQCVEEPAPPR